MDGAPEATVEAHFEVGVAGAGEVALIRQETMPPSATTRALSWRRGSSRSGCKMKLTRSWDLRGRRRAADGKDG